MRTSIQLFATIALGGLLLCGAASTADAGGKAMVIKRSAKKRKKPTAPTGGAKPVVAKGPKGGIQ